MADPEVADIVMTADQPDDAKNMKGIRKLSIKNKQGEASAPLLLIKERSKLITAGASQDGQSAYEKTASMTQGGGSGPDCSENQLASANGCSQLFNESRKDGEEGSMMFKIDDRMTDFDHEMKELG